VRGTERAARVRLRRRLMVLSAIPALAALLIAAKLISVVVIGQSAQRDFDAGATGALRQDVSLLQILDVVQPDITQFTAGALAVLDDQLPAADAQFSDALTHAPPQRACALRINLELVRERQGDVAAWEGRLDDARERYGSALAVVDDAAPGCFAGNDDPNPDRRAVRADTAARIAAKLENLTRVVPQAPPPPPPPTDAAAPPPGGTLAPTDEPQQRRLEPTRGDPLDVLRRLLTDAAGG